MSPDTLAVSRWSSLQDVAGQHLEIQWPELVSLLSTPQVVARKEDLPLISFTRYRDGATRGNDGVLELSAAMFDVDHVTPKEAEDLATRVRDSGYACAVYSTFSHTDAAPRFRIVFKLARPVTAERWRSVWAGLAAELSIPKDETVHDPARLYFVPGHAPGAPFVYEHVNPSGRAVDPDAYPVLPTPARNPTSEKDVGVPELPPSELRRAQKRLIAYFESTPPGVSSSRGGEGRNPRAYEDAAICRDFGLTFDQARELLTEHRLPTYDPPLRWEEAEAPVRNAYRYAQGAPGARLREDQIPGWKDGQANAPVTPPAPSSLPAGDASKARPGEEVEPFDVSGMPPPSVRDDEDASKWGALVLRRQCVPILNERFRLVESDKEDGVSLRLEMDDRLQVRPLANDTRLRRYLAARLEQAGVVLAYRQTTEAISQWESFGKIVREPPLLAWDGDPGLAFTKLPWRPKEGPTPAWDEFLNRCSDPRIVLAYIGSCFTPENESRQVLALKGNGQDGKSVVIRTIAEALGKGATAINDTLVTGEAKRWVLSTVYGRSLVVYPDCRHESFFQEALYRGLTGGDPAPIEYKNRPIFNATIRVRVLVGTNFMPRVDGSAADQSRLLLIEVAPSDVKDDPSWKGRLKSELPALLHKAIGAYRELCPKGGDIRVSDTVRTANEQAAAQEEELFDLVLERFEISRGAEMHLGDFRQALQWITGADPLVRDDKKMGAFKRYAKRTHGIEWVKRKETGGKIVRYVIGVAKAKAKPSVAPNKASKTEAA